MLLVIPLVAAAAAVVALVLVGMQDKGIYSKPVDELVAQKAQLQGKAIRAEGTLVHGSLVKRDQPCEYRFTLTKNAAEIPVRYAEAAWSPTRSATCPGMDLGVTVEGELKSDGSFEASQVLAKCPSKYEMKEEAGAGRASPARDGHAGHGPAAVAQALRTQLP